MSRTYRRKGREPKGLFLEYEWDPNHWFLIETWIPKKSKEGKRLTKKYHSDTQKPWYTGKCHGPSWFINQYIQRPYRRACNQALKTLNDLDSVQILSKPKRIYWD
jgi:hypothetical protein